MPHPSSETLVRFAEGMSRRVETREVVRHLLRGCRVCSVLIAGQVRHDEPARRDTRGGGVR